MSAGRSSCRPSSRLLGGHRARDAVRVLNLIVKRARCLGRPADPHGAWVLEFGAVIVSHRHRFVFVKTYKTAGTSMEIALSEHCGPNDIITKITESDEAQRKQLGFRGPQNHEYPLTRHSPRELVGAVKKRHQKHYVNHSSSSEIRRGVGADVWENYFKFTIERNPFDKAISRYFWSNRKEPRPPIEDYLLSVPASTLSNWGLYTISDRAAVDFILRYESLAQDLGVLSERLGLEVRMPDTKAKGDIRTDRRDYRDVLSPISRARIEGSCWREMSLLGYEW